MEFINVLENSYPLFELCKENDWTDAEDWEEFFNDGGELSFFEGDPDMIKIGSRIGYFCKCGEVVYYYFDDCHEHDAEFILRKFFSTYKTGVTLGGVGYADGKDPEEVKNVSNWDEWNKLECAIAFRGGGGYHYWFSDWTDWFEKYKNDEKVVNELFAN